MRLHQAKRRDGAAALRLVILLPAAASMIGCSLLDGWGGLEGGGSGGHDAAGATDGGDGATMPVVGVACGATHCATNAGCCVPAGVGAGTCVQPTACDNPGSFFFLCNDSSECVSPAKCCLNIGTGVTAVCTTGTCQTQLCSEPGSPCPTGGTCGQSTSGLPLPTGYYECH